MTRISSQFEKTRKVRPPRAHPHRLRPLPRLLTAAASASAGGAACCGAQWPRRRRPRHFACAMRLRT